ncbi:MAG: methylmalonyl-CoA epimerase [Candidatus Zixiibacteriota bacterium]|nr:MAG: methylmalonyl-CoA epimerase [candidate division Zixibacteria bacterium]
MSNPLVSHIGIAVEDLRAAVKQYSILLGREPECVREVPDQKVKVAIFPGGVSKESSISTRVELLTPISDDSPISRFLASRGEGMHHVCVYVDDIKAKLVELKAAGFKLIDETPRIGAEGNRIAFVHPSGAHGVLLELEERAR